MIRSPWLIALFHPLNVIAAGLSVAAGLLAAWWLFPVGLLFWAVMVLGVARDQGLRFNYAMQQRAPLAQRFQNYFDRIVRSQLNTMNGLVSTPPRKRKVLQPVLDAMNRLTDSVYALCQRMTALENYRRVSQSRGNLTQDVQQIEAMIERTTDPQLRKEYVESREALQLRITKQQEIHTQLERVEAQLLALVNEMDALTTEIARLQAANIDSASAHVPVLIERLEVKIAKLQAFESALVQV